MSEKKISLKASHITSIRQLFRSMTAAEYVSPPPFRDVPVDILRGSAIAIMVCANLIPYALALPVPFWLRLVSSVAAPLFIFISGMMVALSCSTKNRTFRYYLIRGGFVILIAALLDLGVQGLLPFVSVDVLYLIGISLPLAWLFLTLGLRARMLVITSVLVATPVLQSFWGYGALPIQVPFFPLLSGAALPGPAIVIHQWLIDGWFPLFPWIVLSLLGAQAGSFRWRDGTIVSFARREFSLLAGGLFVAGALFLYLWPGAMLTRYGYVELFYPPTIEFLLAITGLIFCLFALADYLVAEGFRSDFLRAMGECSLAIYILHILVIGILIAPLGLSFLLPLFLGTYILLLAGMILTAYLIRYIRDILKAPSFVVRTLIGG